MCGSKQKRGGFRRYPETTERQSAERALFEQAQAGNQEALNELMKRHEGLVHYTVQRQELYDLPYEDIAQAGRYGLWRAIMRYDQSRGYCFSTYAYTAIMRQVWAIVQRMLKSNRRRILLGVLKLYWYKTEVGVGTARAEQEVRESLQAQVRRMPRRLGFVIEKRYGLGDEAPQTYQTIGEQMGVCRERVRQLHSEALVWLRQPAHSQELRSLLDRHTEMEYEWAEEMAQAWLRKRGGRDGR
jgi:RNA polymerase sigma factor (sigma-70 family)